MEMTQRMMMKRGSMNPGWCAGLAFVVLTLAGCASSKHHAPVEDHTMSGRAAGAAVTVGSVTADPQRESRPVPGAENAARMGYYTVKPSDTLIRIGLETGQNWKDLIKWNNLDNPNLIEVGQVLRVVPPGTDATTAGTKPIVPSKAETRPLDARGAVIAAANTASLPASPASAAAFSAGPLAGVAASAPASAREGDDNINWTWPASGPVVASFDGSRRKGLGIGGKTGDPVFAAADARVVYAGSGLRGYGNLVILKHNNTYLTAYAHNQTLLVKEDQAVRRGQKIAEMGATDADKVQLDFEIRKLGKPIDPSKLLPPR